MLRARAMRAFAARWRFQYIGPAIPKWEFPKVRPPLPVSFSLGSYPVDEIRQVWNVIEGQQNGVPVLIFDSVIGEGKGTYCTFIACRSRENPFGNDTFTDSVIPFGAWTALYRIPFLQILPWTMGMQRLDRWVNRLRLARPAGLLVAKSPRHTLSGRSSTRG